MRSFKTINVILLTWFLIPFSLRALERSELLKSTGLSQLSASGHTHEWKQKVNINLAALRKAEFLISLPDLTVIARKNHLGLTKKNIFSFSSEGTQGDLYSEAGELLGSFTYTAAQRGIEKGANLTLRLFDGRAYVVSKRGSGYELQKLDLSANCDVTKDSPVSEAYDGYSIASVSSVTPTSTIDLLVVYTPKALSQAGSLANLTAMINNGVQSINVSLSESNIPLSVQAIHIHPLGSDLPSETSPDLKYNDLDKLRLATDGNWDGIHSVRESYGADLVSVLSGGVDTGAVANFYNGSSNWVFSLLRLNRIATTVEWAHEIGHNLGADHDDNNAVGLGAASYSRGFRWENPPGQIWRSVMSYGPGLITNKFSGPDIYHMGAATGDSQHDNARTLRNIGPSVALFRERRAAAPTNVKASDGASTKYINISWSAVSGAPYYRVYRNTTNSQSGPEYQALSSTWQSHLYFRDSTARSGIKYWYWVHAAFNGDGNGKSVPSNGDSGYVAKPETIRSKPR